MDKDTGKSNDIEQQMRQIARERGTAHLFGGTFEFKSIRGLCGILQTPDTQIMLIYSDNINNKRITINYKMLYSVIVFLFPSQKHA